MPGSERDDHALTSPGAYLRGADDRFGRVVASLHDDVGPEGLHQLERGVLAEDGHGVYRLEPRENVCAIGFAANGTLGSLEATHARVAVDADDERITALARSAEDVEMAGMQQVEDAVREDDAAALGIAPAAGADPVEDLARGIEGTQNERSARG